MRSGQFVAPETVEGHLTDGYERYILEQHQQHRPELSSPRRRRVQRLTDGVSKRIGDSVRDRLNADLNDFPREDLPGVVLETLYYESDAV